MLGGGGVEGVLRGVELRHPNKITIKMQPTQPNLSLCRRAPPNVPDQPMDLLSLLGQLRIVDLHLCQQLRFATLMMLVGLE